MLFSFILHIFSYIYFAYFQLYFVVLNIACKIYELFNRKKETKTDQYGKI